MRLISNFDLTGHTTFHIPAQTALWGEYDDAADLVRLLNEPAVAGLPRMAQVATYCLSNLSRG
jgi:hypothetical protein